MVRSRIFLFLVITFQIPLCAAENNSSKSQEEQVQPREIESNSIFDYCHCGTLRTVGKNKVSENLLVIWQNLDCFHQCWLEQKFSLSAIRNYLGQPIWIDDRKQQCCFGTGLENVESIAVEFILGKFKLFYGGCEKFKDDLWGHPWYRSKFWNDAILDSIIYQPVFLLNENEKAKLIASQKSSLGAFDSLEFYLALERIGGYHYIQTDRKTEIEIIKSEVLKMNQMALTDSNDMRPYRYFICLYGSMSQHYDSRIDVFESWIQREPKNLELRLEASIFYISEYCNSWVHRGNGEWEAQNENRELLLKAKSHLEFVFEMDNNSLYALERLLLIAYWMDDCTVGIKYRNTMVNYFCVDTNSDLIKQIDRWLQNCPRGFWGRSD